jgi:hypothetical protein
MMCTPPLESSLRVHGPCLAIGSDDMGPFEPIQRPLVKAQVLVAEHAFRVGNIYKSTASTILHYLVWLQTYLFNTQQQSKTNLGITKAQCLAPSLSTINLLIHRLSKSMGGTTTKTSS